MRKIFIVSERRADYSRFKTIMRLLKKDPFFQIHLVVTGISLLKGHGEDIKKIKADGFTIHATIPMFKEVRSDNGAEMVNGMARVMLAITKELEKAKPDIVLSGFDIGANLATTIAAAHMNIPVAHVQGGEVTGSIDESIRHAMSKFSHYHFPATADAKDRLVRMGERPENIFVVGCPSLDSLLQAPEIPILELEKKFKVDFNKPVVLMIQHPVTTENVASRKQISETIKALSELKIQTIVLLPNNDAGYADIIDSIKNAKFSWLPSITIEEMANLYRHIHAIVGNSSSGIHEAPSFGVPAVNIGTRQQGRERAMNVIDVPYKASAIKQALKKAIYDTEFRTRLKNMKNPYGDGTSAKQIVRYLKKLKLKNVVQKQFYE